MSYKKVILNQFGGPEVLNVAEEIKLPEPAQTEVRVKVLAASTTFTDTMIRNGTYYGFKEKPPLSPGYDMVGIVDATGSGVTEFSIGDMVADLTIWGAYTEYMIRPAEALVAVPRGLDPAEAVSMVLSYVTAYQMLHRSCMLNAGNRILVHGAGGAVGTALLELGNLMDLELYGTASKSKHELVTRLGATPIDYNSEDFVEVMKGIGGVDAVFDAISGENFKRSFRSLRKGGSLIAYGFYDAAMGKGGSVPLDFLSVVFMNLLPNGRKASFYGIGQLREKHPDWFKEDLAALFQLLEAGKIKPTIERRIKLEDAQEAHTLIESAVVKGRIVMELNR